MCPGDLITDSRAASFTAEVYAALVREARAIRLSVAEVLKSISSGGHYGGCLSVVEILLGLYRSKGHSTVTLYVVLRQLGYFSTDLHEYAGFNSQLEGHPDMLSVNGIDFSTGSLGQSLCVGMRMALALGSTGTPVWVVLGDGECQEGQIWEAAMLASVYSIELL
jgi:transketolase